MATKKPKLEEKPPVKKHGGARPGTGGAMPGAGRPAFVPTAAERKQVEALSGYGLPIDQIAVLVRDGIHIDTLRAHFATELVSGKAKANGQVGKTLFQKVMAGDTTAAIWWSKTQMRWAETQKHELTGADGTPLEFTKIERVVIRGKANSQD
jgi:hypothetical protein